MNNGVRSVATVKHSMPNGDGNFIGRATYENGVARLQPPRHPILHTVRSAMTNFTSPPAGSPGAARPGRPWSPAAREPGAQKPGARDPGLKTREPGGREPGSREPRLPASRSRARGSRLMIMAEPPGLMMVMALGHRLMRMTHQPGAQSHHHHHDH